jgi:hypothetical protein
MQRLETPVYELRNFQPDRVRTDIDGSKSGHSFVCAVYVELECTSAIRVAYSTNVNVMLQTAKIIFL